MLVDFKMRERTLLAFLNPGAVGRQSNSTTLQFIIHVYKPPSGFPCIPIRTKRDWYWAYDSKCEGLAEFTHSHLVCLEFIVEQIMEVARLCSKKDKITQRNL
jgi:hypothetical protein